LPGKHNALSSNPSIVKKKKAAINSAITVIETVSELTPLVDKNMILICLPSSKSSLN
jgi:hypothetical protein